MRYLLEREERAKEKLTLIFSYNSKASVFVLSDSRCSYFLQFIEVTEESIFWSAGGIRGMSYVKELDFCFIREVLIILWPELNWC